MKLRYRFVRKEYRSIIPAGRDGARLGFRLNFFCTQFNHIIFLTKMDNRVSFSMNEADKQEVLAALNVLNNKLLPLLTELAQGESRELPSMGDKSYAFVFKALEFAKQYPEYASLIDVAEFERDVNTVGVLRELHLPLSQLTKKLHDTMALAGSEAYVSGLTYYGSAKEGVKRKIPNAILIKEELGKRFPGHPKVKKEE